MENSKVKELVAKIEEATTLFRQEFGTLNNEQLNQKPNAETWSIAQNLDHLIVINNSYYPVVQALRAGKLKLPFTSKIGFIVRFFGNFILQSVQPDRKRKMKTFPVWEVTQSKIEGDILSKFEEEQKKLSRFLLSCEDLIQAKAVIHSPANQNIVYSLERAFEIIVMHEFRHFEQAKEVKTALSV